MSLFKLSQLKFSFQLTQYLWFSKLFKVFRAAESQELEYLWEVTKDINFETNRINYIIIQTVSAWSHIPVDSLLMVLQRSQSFQTFKKLETSILLSSYQGYRLWDKWNKWYYYSNCLNLNLYSSWLNICGYQYISKFSQL